jgi:hypothetical protein
MRIKNRLHLEGNTKIVSFGMLENRWRSELKSFEDEREDCSRGKNPCE